MSLPNFDRVAGAYRWMEALTFGRALHRARTASLPELANESGLSHALVLGDGDGRFTHDLLAHQPHLHVHAVDASGAMLQLLRARCSPFRDRLQTTQMDARTFIPAQAGYDLVATHFFLDCFTQPEVEQIVRSVAPALSGRGVWIVSEFAIPAAGPMRWISELVIRALYTGFGLLTGLRTSSLPDYAAVLQRNGLHRTHARRYLGGLLVAEIWRRKTNETLTESF